MSKNKTAANNDATKINVDVQKIIIIIIYLNIWNAQILYI